MAEELKDKQALVIRTLVSKLNEEECQALLIWAEQLLEIRESNVSKIIKAKRAIQASTKSKVLVRLIKLLFSELKRVGRRGKDILWDRRTWPARIGLIGVTIGVATFGKQAAGVAALGSAVGVPLWLVLGAGGTVLGTIYRGT